MSAWANAIDNLTRTKPVPAPCIPRMEKCLHCGKRLVKRQSKYCSKRCAIDARPPAKPRVREKKLATPATCVVCGKTYIRTNGSQKGCSFECRYTLKRAAHRRHREKVNARV